MVGTMLAVMSVHNYVQPQKFKKCHIFRRCWHGLFTCLWWLYYLYVILWHCWYLVLHAACSGKVVKLSLCVPWRYIGNTGITALIRYYSSSWRWVVSFTAWPLYPWGKKTQYPLGRTIRRHRNQFWLAEIVLLPLHGIKQCFSVFQPLADPLATMLCWFPIVVENNEFESSLSQFTVWVLFWNFPPGTEYKD
jgi:hypothetical protein